MKRLYKLLMMRRKPPPLPLSRDWLRVKTEPSMEADRSAVVWLDEDSSSTDLMRSSPAWGSSARYELRRYGRRVVVAWSYWEPPGVGT